MFYTTVSQKTIFRIDNKLQSAARLFHTVGGIAVR